MQRACRVTIDVTPMPPPIPTPTSQPKMTKTTICRVNIPLNAPIARKEKIRNFKLMITET